MCGIFAYISKDKIDESKYKDLVKEGLKCQHRGPDNTKYRMENDHIFLQFHRLCINDLSSNIFPKLYYSNITICLLKRDNTSNINRIHFD